MPRGDRVLSRLVHERFVVTLLDGATFSGLLRDNDARVIVLVDVEQLSPNGDRIAVDGQLYIERARVAYMQRP